MRNSTKDKITVAIGDGANDVNMIQSAHIGIGIMGKEGNQASAFSDFAIKEYKDLRRLMFWHGRDVGHRYSDFVPFVIVKMSIASWTILLQNLSTGYSAVSSGTDAMFSMYLLVTFWSYWVFLENKVSFLYHSQPG